MIREATIYDIPRMNELGNILNSNFSKVYSINEMLEDNISKAIVYEENNNIVGFILATDLIETCDILTIIVDPNFRRKKIATNLLNYLLGYLSPLLKIVTLEVATKNQAALNLYEKFDFEVVNTRKNYYKDDDAYLMARKCN